MRTQHSLCPQPERKAEVGKRSAGGRASIFKIPFSMFKAMKLKPRARARRVTCLDVQHPEFVNLRNTQKVSSLVAHIAVVVVLLLGGLCTSLEADEKSKVPPDQVVGSVYGKEITAQEIGLTEPIDQKVQFDARNEARWKLMMRITQQFGKPVQEQFIEQQKIDATAEEIAKFNRSMRKINEKQILRDTARLAELDKQLEADDLSKEEREKLVIQQKQLTDNLKFQQDQREDPPEELAKSMIVAWKIERELHRKYGGRVIFQQFGCEALDARRKLYEAAEKKGDLKFEDAGVRYMFYYYSNMQHMVGDAKALEKQPWFLGEEGE